MFNGTVIQKLMNQKTESLVIVILAAGKGTRMRSDKAKVLHSVCGRPMILHVVETAVEMAGKGVVVVIGHQGDKVRETVLLKADVLFAEQKEQKGTGHAVRCALPVLPENATQVIILSGDVPLIKTGTIQELMAIHQDQDNDVTILGTRLENPYGYGRILYNSDGTVERIVEEADANAAEKLINIINSGIYCVKRPFLETSLQHLQSNNRQNELYLTDIVEFARNQGRKIGMMICRESNEVQGVNTPSDLMEIERILVASRK